MRFFLNVTLPFKEPFFIKLSLFNHFFLLKILFSSNNSALIKLFFSYINSSQTPLLTRFILFWSRSLFQNNLVRTFSCISWNNFQHHFMIIIFWFECLKHVRKLARHRTTSTHHFFTSLCKSLKHSQILQSRQHKKVCSGAGGGDEHLFVYDFYIYIYIFKNCYLFRYMSVSSFRLH